MLTTSEEAICRVGLSELAREGIYEINVGKEIQSAVLELNEVFGLEQPCLSADQQSWWEQIGTKISQECDNAKLDFQMDEQVDKKMYKRGCEAAKWAAKLMLREWLLELLDEQDWIDRRAVMNAHNAKGKWLSYYDHLPTNEWMPPFKSEAKAYIRDFDVLAEMFLGPFCKWLRSVYPPTVQDIQLCAALIFWNVVTTLEATYFLTRWLLPFGRLEWNNIKQTLAATRLPQPYAEHLLGDGSERIICAHMQILTLTFDQDFPIVTK